MRVLVICRARAGVDRGQIGTRAGEELAALRELQENGSLREAYSPGGPGAILVFDDAREAVEEALASLPLVQAELIDAEVIELHPLADLAPNSRR